MKTDNKSNLQMNRINKLYIVNPNSKLFQMQTLEKP
jgi:hypothetical protein